MAAPITWLTTKEVATKLGVSSSTVRRWIAERGLTYSDIGAGKPKIRVSEADLDAWVKNPNKAA